ncbi:heme efflux system ATPase HrtA [Lachnospiraceae bacterium KM106-2]|nr:heme efflux system ATPase HrtA [Lachnospiraceae bacterium KM106-2]
MSNHVLQLNHITKKYKDGNQEKLVLDDISLEVSQGEFVAIVGPSGSGKSTLLSIMGVLLSPTSGELHIGDINTANLKQKDWTNIRRERIGFIFQSHELVPFLTVKEQLSLIKGMNKKRSSIEEDELLEELGLAECKKQYPSQLSGGQKQRVAIARAFMNDPSVILADEPTASLDGERGRQVVEMIREQTKKNHKASVMVTHDERVLDLVDTIYHLEDGRLVRVK